MSNVNVHNMTRLRAVTYMKPLVVLKDVVSCD